MSPASSATRPCGKLGAATIIPQILASKLTGTADSRLERGRSDSGEEAFTLAILLAEALGMDEFRSRVKIYATDIDEEALNQARQAVFTSPQVAEVPPALLHKYFDQQGDRYALHKDLRRAVIFGRHNLVHDVPISRLDILVCRNTLMYFNAELQTRILARFHFALNDGGFLILGKAETLLINSHLFVQVDLKRRVFPKCPMATAARLRIPARADREGRRLLTAGCRCACPKWRWTHRPRAGSGGQPGDCWRWQTNGRASLFRLTPRDIGTPFL